MKPLESILTKKPICGYPRQIFMLTDGCVSDTTKIKQFVSRSCKYSRVHTIGVGDQCSRDLIIEVAKKGKGHHVFIQDNDDPSEKIIQILVDSLTPVIS